MSNPHFKVGDLVRVLSPTDQDRSDAFIYVVTSILLDMSDEPQYRLKPICGWLEQAMPERGIVPAIRIPQPRL